MSYRQIKRIINQSHTDAYDLMLETWLALDKDFAQAMGDAMHDAMHDDNCPASMELMDFFDEYAEVGYPLASNIKCFVRTAHEVLENPNDSDFNKIVALTDICIKLGQDLDGVFLDGLKSIKPYAQSYDFSPIADSVRNIREFILVMNDGFAKTRDGINAVRSGE